MIKKEQRYCFKKDDDCYWYMIPIELASEFVKMCEEAYKTDDFKNFYIKFDNMRINSGFDFTFLDPQEWDEDEEK